MVGFRTSFGTHEANALDITNNVAKSRLEALLTKCPMLIVRPSLSRRAHDVEPSRWRELRRSLVYLRPHSVTIGTVVFITLACSGITATEPLVHKAIFDRLASLNGSPSMAALAWLLLGLLVLVVMRQVGEAASSLLAWKARLSINRELLNQATARLHELPLAYHQSRGIGETMTRVDRGITAFMEALASIAFQVLPAVAYLTLSLVFMLRLSPALALVAILFVVPPLVFGRGAMRRLVELERAILDRWCRIYDRFQQVLAGMKTVKSFAREHEEQALFVSSVADTQREVLRSVRMQAKLGVGRGLCIQLGRVMVLGVGSFLAYRGDIGLGTLVAFLGYLGGLYAAVQSLLGLYESIRRAELGLATFFSILDAKNEVPDEKRAIVPGSLAGEIGFHEVSFRYPGGTSRAALDRVSCVIRAGEFVAVVGRSGAGKSTFADLILRFYDPVQGSITIDGIDIRRLSQRAFRKYVGVVSQEPFLFDDTIEANLKYGNPSATAAEVERAARAANAHDFIQALPEGYRTPIGRGGVALSGGERQRLAIARMILKDPRIVILDEPTSALDVEAEAAVHDAILRLAKGRTTILIAHRLNTTLQADRVLLFEEGRLVQEGRPSALVAIDGPYRNMLGLWQADGRRVPSGSFVPAIAETR